MESEHKIYDISQDELGYVSCLHCKEGRNLPVLVLHQIGVPPGKPEHNIGYDHTVISSCDRCGCGLLEIRKHDCFDFEDVWDQYEWFKISSDDMGRMRERVAACPAPLSPSCNCPLHKGARSSAASLPQRSWDTVLESSHHVHMLNVQWVNNRPRFHLTETAPTPVQSEPQTIEMDPDYPADFFRNLDIANVEKLIGENLLREKWFIKWFTYLNYSFLIGVFVYTVMMFGWWSLLVLPPLGFGWFLCYGTGAIKERYPTAVIGVVAVALGIGISSFFANHLAWFVLVAVWGIFGWMMNFVSKCLFVSLLKRNPAAAERIKQKE